MGLGKFIDNQKAGLILGTAIGVGGSIGAMHLNRTVMERADRVDAAEANSAALARDASEVKRSILSVTGDNPRTSDSVALKARVDTCEAQNTACEAPLKAEAQHDWTLKMTGIVGDANDTIAKGVNTGELLEMNGQFDNCQSTRKQCLEAVAKDVPAVKGPGIKG